MRKVSLLVFFVFSCLTTVSFAIENNKKIQYAKFKYNYVRGLYLYEATPPFFLKLEQIRLEGNIKHAIDLLYGLLKKNDYQKRNLFMSDL